MRALPVAAVLLATGLSSADPRPPELSRRSLGGHLFIQSLSLADPFVSTRMSVQVGGGATFVDPRRTLHNQGWSVAAQVAVLRGWALRLSGGAGLVSSSRGTVTHWEVTPGTTLSWRVTDWLRLGPVLDFNYRIAQSTRWGERSDAFKLMPGLALAIAAHPSLGITFNVQHIWERRQHRTPVEDDSRLGLAVAIDLDLMSLVRMPIGFMVAYRGELALVNGTPSLHDLEGGIYYTGRIALSLGLVARGRWHELWPTPTDATSASGHLVVQYYFN
jgi:hypothetical protein